MLSIPSNPTLASLPPPSSQCRVLFFLPFHHHLFIPFFRFPHLASSHHLPHVYLSHISASILLRQHLFTAIFPFSFICHPHLFITFPMFVLISSPSSPSPFFPSSSLPRVWSTASWFARPDTKQFPAGSLQLHFHRPPPLEGHDVHHHGEAGAAGAGQG